VPRVFQHAAKQTADLDILPALPCFRQIGFLVGFQNVLEGNDALQPPKVSTVDDRQEGSAPKPAQRHIQGVVWMDVDEGQPSKKASDHRSALPLGGCPLGLWA